SSFKTLFMSLGLSLLLSQCASERMTPLSSVRPVKYTQRALVSDTSGTGGVYWAGDEVSGPASIKIRLCEQRAYFYKGDKCAGVSPISSGREGHATVTGRFS